jgi:tripeptide aminopeptidase
VCFDHPLINDRIACAPRRAYFGPQNALLTILVLTGLDGVTKPALQVRQAK